MTAIKIGVDDYNTMARQQFHALEAVRTCAQPKKLFYPYFNGKR
jgi:hypothetical protein